MSPLETVTATCMLHCTAGGCDARIELSVVNVGPSRTSWLAHCLENAAAGMGWYRRHSPEGGSQPYCPKSHDQVESVVSSARPDE